MTVEERNDFAGREAERTAPGGDDPAWDGDRLREAVAFFRNEKGFRRLITLMIQKYRALGRVGGSVKIRDLTPEEREAFSSFLGANFEGRRTAVISLERFARALEETRFAGLPLAAVLEGVAGEPLIPDKERREREEARKRAFFDGLRERFPASYCRRWLDAIGEKRPGTRGVHRAYDRDPRSLEEKMEHVLAALTELERRRGDRDANRMERLPLFAARITGDPHGFDPDTERGRLLMAALTLLRAEDTGEEELQAQPEGSPAEALTELYHFFGLLRDDLTNFVTCTGLLAFDRQGRILPVFDAACRSRSVLNVPLREMIRVARACPAAIFPGEGGQAGRSGPFFGDQQEGWAEQSGTFPGNQEETRADRPWSLSMDCGEERTDQPGPLPGAPVFVVENSGVFSALLDGWEDPFLPPLICTHGQTKLAALLLLDALAAAGAVIRYSGDFDPEGLLMADRLLRRHPNRVLPWRYSVDDYLCCRSDKPLSPRRLKQLMGVRSPALQPVKEAILRSGRPGYQERMADRLLADMRRLTHQIMNAIRQKAL